MQDILGCRPGSTPSRATVIPEMGDDGRFDRCPLAIVRDWPPDVDWWVEQAILLATAEARGSLGVWLADPSERTERLVAVAAAELRRMRAALANKEDD
jgi:hypothetical protein